MQVIQSGLVTGKKKFEGRNFEYLPGESYPFEKIQGFAEVWYRIFPGSTDLTCHISKAFGKYDALSSETFFEYFIKQKGTLK